ncbi:hypothetical protein PG997_007117 [Apiospora hydei]|uniref:Uncharacterized protein n=1 Tax=Apiospora hydei TaxID=1337664 RepID=A0ABR1WQP9_9PEZI
MASEDLDSYAFEVGMVEAGEEGNSFRTQNDPKAPIQREWIVQRTGAIDIRCTAKDVIHGYLESGEGYATLIVHDFQFDPRKTARRISSVDIEFFYYAMDGAPSPETLVQTTQTETKTSSTDLTAGADGFGAQVGGGRKWETTINRETTDTTRIIGSMDIKKRNYGKPNTASWTLLENKSAETGVPAHLRVAILLKRHDDDTEFQCECKIKARVDLVSRIGAMFRSVPKDDPILYDPTRDPTNVLRRPYDVENLGAVQLEDLTVVEFTNNEDEAEKAVQPAK